MKDNQETSKQIAEVVEEKKGIMSRLGRVLFSEDGVKSIGASIVSSIILPGIRDMISDGLHTTIDMMFSKGHDTPRYGKWSSRGVYTDYQRAYTGTPTVVRSGNKYLTSVKPINTVDFYTIKTRQEAMDVLVYLLEQANTYGSVPVGEYYVLIGKGGDYEYVGYDQGWYPEDLENTTVKKTIGGWYIDFPKLRNIK